MKLYKKHLCGGVGVYINYVRCKRKKSFVMYHNDDKTLNDLLNSSFVCFT